MLLSHFVVQWRRVEPSSLKLLQVSFLFVLLLLSAPQSEFLDDSFGHIWMESSLLFLSAPLVLLEILLLLEVLLLHHFTFESNLHLLQCLHDELA